MNKKVRLILTGLVLVITLSLVIVPTGEANAQGGCTQTHVVQYGENLFRIGLRYGVQWPTLQVWNNLGNPNQIYAGQVLCVSGPYPVVTPPPPPSRYGTVIYPGNPFGPTHEPRVYFPQVTLGVSAQLHGYNFPPHTQVTIAMTTLGNRPYVPYYTATTDASGQFFVEVGIPTELQYAGTVAFDVRTWNGYYARNWFYNL